MSSTIKWTFYATEQAYDHNWNIKEITRNYALDCFEATNYDVSITLADHRPNPPEEHSLGGSDDQIDNTTCKSSPSSYSYLCNWFQDYIDCNNLPISEDGVLLITDGPHGGGVSDGYYATVDAYHACADLTTSSTQERACSRAHRDMSVACQELGHNLSLDHDHGYAYQGVNNSDNWYMTPMRSTRAEELDEQYNRCDDYVGDFTTHDRCYEFAWSECSEKNITS